MHILTLPHRVISGTPGISYLDLKYLTVEILVSALMF